MNEHSTTEGTKSKASRSIDVKEAGKSLIEGSEASKRSTDYIHSKIDRMSSIPPRIRTHILKNISKYVISFAIPALIYALLTGLFGSTIALAPLIIPGVIAILGLVNVFLLLGLTTNIIESEFNHSWRTLLNKFFAYKPSTKKLTQLEEYAIQAKSIIKASTLVAGAGIPTGGYRSAIVESSPKISAKRTLRGLLDNSPDGAVRSGSLDSKYSADSGLAEDSIYESLLSSLESTNQEIQKDLNDLSRDSSQLDRLKEKYRDHIADRELQLITPDELVRLEEHLPDQMINRIGDLEDIYTDENIHSLALKVAYNNLVEITFSNIATELEIDTPSEAHASQQSHSSDYPSVKTARKLQTLLQSTDHATEEGLRKALNLEEGTYLKQRTMDYQAIVKDFDKTKTAFFLFNKASKNALISPDDDINTIPAVMALNLEELDSRYFKKIIQPKKRSDKTFLGLKRSKDIMFTPTQEILKLDGAMIRYRKLLANNAQDREIKVVEKDILLRIKRLPLSEDGKEKFSKLINKKGLPMDREALNRISKELDGEIKKLAISGMVVCMRNTALDIKEETILQMLLEVQHTDQPAPAMHR
ncbi:hypothetical protein [Candidatus Synchoanobacter obligatus]|uniref:Uncharacterized protein n=1 Tax=Candidatus Synchoanobacter obligatus TaxID=2919597 RepID=A0ABT1L608_9GAMM|nr:hypothetical protein [Candidatus Synchoanobacter obligatus]MCP8352612.1 hypothetical protein [Candidatus Synchoanobacter obligatus]